MHNVGLDLRVLSANKRRIRLTVAYIVTFHEHKLF